MGRRQVGLRRQRWRIGNQRTAVAITGRDEARRSVLANMQRERGGPEVLNTRSIRQIIGTKSRTKRTLF
jgi:hypothetical protein